MSGRKTFVSDEEKRFYTELGALIQAYRTRLGLTQADVACALGVTFQQVQKYESAMNRVPVFVLHQMSKIYNVSFANIIGAGMNDCDYRVLDGDEVKSIICDIKNDLNNLCRVLKIKK